MIATILSALAGLIIATISRFGYMGIFLLMAIESACIPLPSEIVMPFSGYLAFTGALGLWQAALAGALGCVLGSMIAYYAGSLGGRPLLEKYGRYVLVSMRDLNTAQRWFQRYGDIIIFLGRLLPVIRTFIALPAGIARMPVWRFIIYTFAGSYLWCLGLAWIGLKLGQHWDTLGTYFHRFDTVIGVLLMAGAFWYVRRHLAHIRSDRG